MERTLPSRRTVLKGAAGAAGAITVAGCAESGNGDGGNGDGSNGNGGSGDAELQFTIGGVMSPPGSG